MGERLNGAPDVGTLRKIAQALGRQDFAAGKAGFQGWILLEAKDAVEDGLKPSIFSNRAPNPIPEGYDVQAAFSSDPATGVGNSDTEVSTLLRIAGVAASSGIAASPACSVQRPSAG